MCVFSYVEKANRLWPLINNSVSLCRARLAPAPDRLVPLVSDALALAYIPAVLGRKKSILVWWNTVCIDLPSGEIKNEGG